MMSSIEVDWERQRAFLAVVRSGSLSGAARLLGLAQPTVRGRIEALEAAAGVPLFTRSPGGLTPTETGLALTEHARAMELAADAFGRTASAAAGDLAGTVRISASDVIAVEVLPPILARFRIAHPRIELVLSPTNRNEDMLRREADIAVRMVRPTQDGLVARRIGAVPLGFHAQDAYLARAGRPESLAALLDHPLIGFEHEQAALRPVLQAMIDGGLVPAEPRFTFRSDHDLAQLAAIRAGLGIGVCQVPLAARDGHLVHLFPAAFAYPLETWLVMHEDLRALARVRVVFDALAEGLAAYIAGAD